MSSTRVRRNNSTRLANGSIAEISPAFYILLLFLVFPLINLLGLALAMGAIGIIGTQCAGRAADQPTYDEALASMSQEVIHFGSTGFVKFLNLQPVGGFQNCGMDLYVKATAFRNGKNKTFGPNTPVPPPVDPTSYTYEYTTHTVFQISPWVNMAGVPFIGSVPGLGKPYEIHYDVSRAIENPGGLEAAPSTNNSSGSAVAFMPPPAIADTPVPLLPQQGTLGGWNYPNLYQMIAADGETVISTSVLIVYADNGHWTPTNLQIDPGVKVWIDYWSTGEWSHDAGQTFSNANGQTPAFEPGALPFPLCSMVGQINGGTPFLLGAKQWNFSPPNTGALSMAMNDFKGPQPPNVSPTGYETNVGEQIVRVVLAR